MNLRLKLIALFLAISLIPLSGVGFLAVDGMDRLNQDAQDRSGASLENEITDQLNNSVTARQEGIQNLFNQRQVDVRSLSSASAMENYLAASEGELELIQDSSQSQLGYMALQMHSGIDSAVQKILDAEYDGRAFDELAPAQQREVERKVEALIGGTTGDGIQMNGTMADAFEPGYIGDTGYAYITDLESNIIVHHSLEDGHNLKEDSGGTLTVFEEVKSNIQSSDTIRAGEDWGVAEYLWEDTTQAGNPELPKFIAYTYYEPFDWILAPNVYYHELQETALEDAKREMERSFERYLLTRTITVGENERLAYDQLTFAGPNGSEIIHADRSGEEVTSGANESQSYAEADWFTMAKSGGQDQVHFSEIQTSEGHEQQYVATPVYRDGSFEGVIAAKFNYSIVTETTDRVTVGENGFLYVLNGDGEIVSHPDREQVTERAAVADGAYGSELADIAGSQMLSGESGMTTYTRQTDGSDNETRYVAYAPLDLGMKQFTLVATVPESDVTGPVAALGVALDETAASARNLILLVFAIAALGVAVAGYGAARYISKPIEQVRDRATALSQGRFENGEDISAGDDEIGEMVEAFEEMRLNLNRQVEQIEAVSESLGEGRLDDEVQTDFPGKFGAIMEDLQAGMDQLGTSFGEISRASGNLRDGDLDQDLDTDLPGEYGRVMAELDAGLAELSASFEQLRAVSRDLSEGKLDQELDTDRPGAYGDVLANIAEGLDAVEESIARVQSIAQEVSVASDEVATSATEIEQTSEDVARSVQEIANGADEQSENLEEVASEMNDMSATVEEIASSSVDVAETAGEAADRAREGSEQAGAASTEIREIEAEATEAVDGVGTLRSEMDEINEIVGMISEIAEQTNMLALNASIEAARAGEAGEGFAVVADEIKGLAGEAAQATEEVESLITEIQSRTDETVTDIERMAEKVQSGSETIEDAIDFFEEIEEAAEQAAVGVQEISDATDDQAASTEEVVAMVDEVSSVSEETAAEASNVSAATEEQTSSLSQVSENVRSVAGLADDLEALVEQFEVSNAEVTADTADQAAEPSPGDN
ncbi:methyl-accepting chemotaxis protein [Halorhabdus salina]|uniref:methyl-accepting chemotaxis protein n=1 Tax=Halorhabdus salina TaxID=2750670 RepID=UPI0015EF1D78|nr:methyl-accepting chemotaxis protein [Halorhabdus salina]